MKTDFLAIRKIRAIPVVMMAMVAGAAAAQNAQEGMMTDEQITRAITTELAFSDVVMFDGVDVVVEDGMVTLDGAVGSLAAKRQAEEIAEVIDGVMNIANDIEIDSEPVAANEMQMAVASALRENPATDKYEIEVAAGENGQVTLTGTVDSMAESSLAETVAATVPGIRSIDNRIEVDTSRYYRAAEEIDAEIAERLRWDTRVDDDRINILVRDGGRVTLSGEVASLAAKRRAIELAEIEGVHMVDATHLEVVGRTD